MLYGPDETFPVGGSKVLRRSAADEATIVAAGVTVAEALEAHERLRRAGLRRARDRPLQHQAPGPGHPAGGRARDGPPVTVEDHYPEGGLGEAVAAAVGGLGVVHGLAVRRKPRSGKPAQLLAYEGIDADAIVDAVERGAH